MDALSLRSDVMSSMKILSRQWVAGQAGPRPGSSLIEGGVPREQKMLKGHLPRVIYHQVYSYTKIKTLARGALLGIQPSVG